jgi:hypothetical protein
MNKIADRLDARPTGRRIFELSPSQIQQPIAVAKTTREKEDDGLVRKFFHRDLAGTPLMRGELRLRQTTLRFAKQVKSSECYCPIFGHLGNVGSGLVLPQLPSKNSTANGVVLGSRTERTALKFRVGYELQYEFPQPTPLVAMLNIHFSRVADLAAPDHVVISPSVRLHTLSGI